jgi:thiol-disulfide isomerase/thioredoxin
MQKLILACCILMSFAATAQTTTKDRILYGICTKDSLLQEPYSKWYSPNYTDYKPHTETISSLQKQDWKGITIKVFFGSWCGDSKREVPRFMQVLHQTPIAETNVQIIGLGGSDSLYKKSPTNEEKDMGIFRVPVFVIYKNGKEINRINEYPSISLEKDLLAIVSKEVYIPNYASFATIQKWLLDGTLNDDNANTEGLAMQIKNRVSSEYTLNSLAYLLLKRNLKKEALKVFKINYNLYPTSANVLSSLGEGFLKNEEKAKAVTFLELALQENKDKEAFKNILELLYTAKGVSK